jgi:hypothetical protein
MSPPGPVEPAELLKAPKERRETGLSFLLRVFRESEHRFAAEHAS